jgi:cytochrome c biogenesis protein CcdA
MTRTTIIAELTVFLTLILSIIFFGAHIWDETPRGIIVLLVSISLVLGYHTAQFLNRFESGE